MAQQSTPPVTAPPNSPNNPGGPNFEGMPIALRTAAEQCDFAATERLFLTHSRPSAMYYILSGEVRLVRASAAGGEVILQRARHGFLAEASLETTAYHCDAVAVEASTALRFPITTFRNAMDEDAAFRKMWTIHLSQELRRSRAQCERLTLKGAAERVLHFIETEGCDGVVTLTQSRKAWAAELGLSHEALYRTLAQLQRDEVILMDGNQISDQTHK